MIKANFMKLVAIFSVGAMIPSSIVHAGPVARKFYGSFLGISLGALQQDQTFDKSLVQIVIDKEGVHETGYIGNKRFQITYSPDWLVDVRDSDTLSAWFPEQGAEKINYLAIKQSPTSNLALTILEYSPQKKTRSKELADKTSLQMDLVQFLGEGVSLPLAVFLKNDSSGKAKESLRSVYKQLMAEMETPGGVHEDMSKSLLPPIDIEFDIKTLQSANASLDVKKEIIHRAEHAMGFGNSKQIAERVSIFNEAILQSGDPELILYALKRSQLEARVGGMVPIIRSAIELSLGRIQTGKSFYNETEIMSEAINAARVQLYEAHGDHTVLASVQKMFGTLSLSKIHVTTGGNISADDVGVLSQLVSIQSGSARYSSRPNFESLIAVLEKVQQYPMNAQIYEKIQRTLRDYRNPYKTCDKLFGSRK